MKNSDKKFYDKLSGKSLSVQEAFEAKSSFVGFFDLLYRIDKRNKEKVKKAEDSLERKDFQFIA
jgi:hypothetical protein